MDFLISAFSPYFAVLLVFGASLALAPLALVAPDGSARYRLASDGGLPTPTLLDRDPKLRRLLKEAGADFPGSARRFRKRRKLITLSGGAVCVAWGVFSDASFVYMIAGPGIGCLATYHAPMVLLANRASLEREKMNAAVPDVIDLVRLGMSAGASLEKSLEEAARESRDISPGLSRELYRTSHEISAGASKPVALRALAERSGAESLRAATEALAQSVEKGATAAEALETQAESSRTARMTLAEERANLLATKLTIGTLFFTVPPLMIVLLGPAISEMLTSLAEL